MRANASANSRRNMSVCLARIWSQFLLHLQTRMRKRLPGRGSGKMRMFARQCDGMHHMQHPKRRVSRKPYINGGHSPPMAFCDC